MSSTAYFYQLKGFGPPNVLSSDAPVSTQFSSSEKEKTESFASQLGLEHSISDRSFPGTRKVTHFDSPSLVFLITFQVEDAKNHWTLLQASEKIILEDYNSAFTFLMGVVSTHGLPAKTYAIAYCMLAICHRKKFDQMVVARNEWEIVREHLQGFRACQQGLTYQHDGSNIKASLYQELGMSFSRSGNLSDANLSFRQGLLLEGISTENKILLLFNLGVILNYQSLHNRQNSKDASGFAKDAFLFFHAAWFVFKNNPKFSNFDEFHAHVLFGMGATQHELALVSIMQDNESQSYVELFKAIDFYQQAIGIPNITDEIKANISLGLGASYQELAQISKHLTEKQLHSQRAQLCYETGLSYSNARLDTNAKLNTALKNLNSIV